jgi:hypothetical protein
MGLYSQILLECADLTIGNTYYVQAGGYQGLRGFFRIQVTTIDIQGCTNALASNYNSCANEDDGSCIIPGCTNPLASNYNPAATVDNGSCIIPGCTNPAASNYNPAATVDNGSCIIPGCTNPAASNYNPAATVDNGSCIIPGCTNPAASNYNPAATVDNGSCIIPGCTNPAASNYNPAATVDNGSCIILGCTNPAASNYNPAATVDNGSCIIPGCTNPAASNYNPAATVDNGSCIILGCTNPSACNYNPAANTNNGSCTFGVNYYQDLDGDGFGNASVLSNFCSPLPGYVTNSTDCDDSNSAIHPGATEVCDGDDNDCDSTIDEGCSGEFAVNDEQSNAMMLNVTPMGNCNSISGDLSAASPSAQAQSVCITGEDLWYQFVAVSSGVRIQVNSAQNNIVIEIQDEVGNLVNVENLQSVPGNEILNYGDLNAGETYYVCIRNFNSTQGSGAFNMCLNWMQESSCDVGSGPFNLCAIYKADFTNTMNYTFHFTPVGGGETITYASLGSTKVRLDNITGLHFNTSYTVTVDAVYTMSNGLGQSEQVQVTGTSDCLLNIGNPAPLQLRTIDTCPNAKNMFSYIMANPHACGNLGYEWEITRTDIVSDPFVVTSAMNSRLLHLSTLNGFSVGATYSVRVRPIVLSDSEVPFGPARCVQIAGSASAQLAPKGENGALYMTVYPNPASESVNVVIKNSGTAPAQLEVLDLSGRTITSQTLNAESGYSTTLNVGELSAGVYLVRAFNGDQSTSTLFVKE